MACCAACEKTQAYDKARARLSAAFGASAGGAGGTAAGGSSAGPIGAYVGGAAGAAAGSALEDAFRGGSTSCSEPACSWPTVEEWTEEAKRRGASNAQIGTARINGERVFAGVPEMARSVLDKQIPNLRNGTLARYVVALELSKLVAALPPRLNLTPVRRLYETQSDVEIGPAGNVVEKNDPSMPVTVIVLGGLALAGAGGAVWWFTRKKKKRNAYAWKR